MDDGTKVEFVRLNVRQSPLVPPQQWTGNATASVRWNLIFNNFNFLGQTGRTTAASSLGHAMAMKYR